MLQPWPISVRSLTPASCGAVRWRAGGTTWVTVLVKATFELVHGGLAKLSAPLDLVREDRYHGPSGSLEAASEMAPYLPNSGVVLTGHAYAPGGRPAASAAARLVVARDRVLLDKTVHIFGHRNGSVVQPFQRMPLIYERAYGGPDISDNPVGAGTAGTAALPNILDPRHPSRPAGFGPIPRHWLARRRLLGSLDASVLEASEPAIPEVFDWRYFHAAPFDQQIDLLRGDEWIVIDGFHPTLSRVETRLPSAFGKARWHLITTGGVGPPNAVNLCADTLVINTDRMLCSVVWRGHFALARAEMAPWVLVFAGVELPAEPIAWPEPPSPSEQESRLTVPANDAPTPMVPRVPSTHTMTAEHDFRAIIASVMPFQSVTPPASQASSGTTGSISTGRPQAARLYMPENPPVAPLNLAPAGACQPAIPRVPPFSTGTEEVNLQALLRDAIPFTTKPRPGSCAPVVGELEREPARRSDLAALLDAPNAPEAVSPSPPLASPPSVVPPAHDGGIASAYQAPPEGARGRRAQVLSRLQAGASLQGLSLVSADLHELDFSGTSLAGLDLRRSDLRGANLSRARAAEVDLDGAGLTGANAEGADLTNANLTRAVVTDARFDAAVLSGANLQRICGEGASFRGSQLHGADLRQARLQRTVFDDAVLSHTLAINADLSGCLFRRADLSGVSVRAGKLCDADLSDANLEGADLRDADLTRVNARGASCKMTKMTPAQRNALLECARAGLHTKK